MAKTEYELLRGAWIKEECHRRDPEARVNAMAGWFDIAPSTLYVWWNANESKANTPGIQTPNVRRIERKFGLAEGGLLRMGVVRKQPGDEDADSLRPATREFMLRGMKTGWIRVDGTGYPAYDPQNIQCFYDDKELVLPPEISRRHKLKAKGIEERREKQLHEGGMPTVFNGLRYHLSGFRTPRTGKGERATTRSSSRQTEAWTPAWTSMATTSKPARRFASDTCAILTGVAPTLASRTLSVSTSRSSPPIKSS